MAESARSRTSQTITREAAPAAPLPEVFLSPRVVDREAFTEYAASLRQLIEQASAEGAALRSASGDAQLTRDHLKDVAAKSQPRLEAATKALAALDGQAQRAEQLLSAARDTASSLNILSRDSQEAIAKTAVEIQARVEQLRLEQSRRIDETCSQQELRLRTMREAMDRQIETARSENEARLRQTLSQSEGWLSQVETLIQQAEARLEERLRRGEELLSQRWGMMNSRLDEMDRALSGRAEQLTAAVDAKVAAAETRLAELSREIDNRLIRSWTHANELLQQLDTAAKRAETLLGEPPAQLILTADTNGEVTEATTQRLSVHEAIARIESLQTQATVAVGELEALRNDAEATRTTLGESLGQAQHDLTKLTEQAEVARGSLRGTLTAADQQIHGLSERATELAQSLAMTIEDCDSAHARLLTRRDEIMAMAEEPAKRVEEVGAHMRCAIEALLQEIHRAKAAARETSDDASEIMLRTQELMQELRPWAPLLIERKPGGPLPEPLTDLLRGVRGELATDLNRIAGALHQVTAKAARAAETLA